MTRVVFYTGVANRLRFLHQFLYRKVFLSNRSALIFVEKAALNRLDDDLWSQDSFLPHLCLGKNSEDASDTPILLSADEPNPALSVDVLISLTFDLPAFVGRFPTYVDIVGASKEEIAQGRARYRHLKEHGYSIDVHKIS